MYSQVLLAASFAIASYQDVKLRAVSDLAWIPALLGVSIIVVEAAFSSGQGVLATVAVKVAIIGAGAIVLYYLGTFGQADLIILVFYAADPYEWSLFFATFAVAVVMVIHVVYRLMTGHARGTKTIPIEQFLREQHWIPKATIENAVRTAVTSNVNGARDEVEKRQANGMLVEVEYGTPTLAYVGTGYIVYLVAMILFSYGTFSSLP